MAEAPQSGVGGPAGVTEPICAACARVKGAVCCQVARGERLATLSHADVARITEATGLSANRFVTAERLDVAALHAYEEARPLYRDAFGDGLRLELKAVRGACRFFVPGVGCSLPPEAKPLACRLYPFDFDELGELRLVDAPGCLAVERASSWEELMALFGVSRDKLDALRERMLEENRASSTQSAPNII